MKRIILLTSLTMLFGCQPADDSANTKPAANQSSEGDEHAGHDHGHGETGPHGGHLLHLEPSGIHAEWTHDDESGLVTVHLDELESDKIEAVKFVVDIPGAAPEEFPLTAGDEGWSVQSAALMTHMNMGEAATVKLVVVDDSGEQSTKIEHHDHEHHHH